MNRSTDTTSRVLGLALICLAACLVPSPAEAGPPPPPFHTSAAATIRFVSFSCPVREDFQTAPRQSAAAVGCLDVVLLDPLMFSDVRASAEARQGLLRAEALLHAKGSVGPEARATAIFSDTLQVNAAVPPGTPGRLEIRFPYSGRLDASLFRSGGPAPSTPPTATVFVELQVESPLGSFSRFVAADRILNELIGEPEGVLVLPIEFIFGQPFRIEARLTAFVEVDINGFDHQAFASSRYGSTAWWEGVQAVELLSGEPVAEFQIQSESGMDYSEDQYEDGAGLALIHSGGEFVTHPGQGTDGSDVSMIGSDVPVLGFNVFEVFGGDSEWRIADVFELETERVVERIVTFALQPNTQIPDWTGFNMKLFRRENGTLEEIVVAANAGVVPTDAYRVPTGEAFLDSTDHPIHAIQWDLHPLTLPAGEYRFEWQIEGGTALALPAMAINPDDPHNPITASGSAEILTPDGWLPLGNEHDRALATPMQVLGRPADVRIFSDGFEP
jgi:hypothetical protein